VPLEGLDKLKKSTSSGLEPATFRLVAKCLNQLRYQQIQQANLGSVHLIYLPVLTINIF
jgi:hypothetical protein